MYDVRAPPGGEVLTRRMAALDMYGSSWRLPTSARVRRVCFVSLSLIFAKEKGSTPVMVCCPVVFLPL
jgi:hypothetical protein